MFLQSLLHSIRVLLSHYRRWSNRVSNSKIHRWLCSQYLLKSTLKAFQSKVQPLQAKPKKMVREEARNNRTADIDDNHSTMFTLLPDLNIICQQRWMQFELQSSPSRVLHLMVKYTLSFSKPVKSDQN